jgi:predicted O-methyltransferase YrrM
MLYTILKIYSPKIIIELGTWYGNSASYIKENCDKNKLYCFDFFRTIFESEYNIKGDGVDKFYINYPRIESVYKRMQKYNDITLVKCDAINAIDYIKEKHIKPDVIFIDFIKNKFVLYNFLSSLINNFKNTIIIGDDYVFDTVKNAVKKIIDKVQNKYILLSNINAYVLIPIELYNENVKFKLIEKDNKFNEKRNNNPYYLIHNLFKNDKFDKAIEIIIKQKLDLNKKSEYISNDGTIYHDFAFYYRKHKEFKNYLQILNSIEPVKTVLNNFDFTFDEMVKFNTDQLHNA